MILMQISDISTQNAQGRYIDQIGVGSIVDIRIPAPTGAVGATSTLYRRTRANERTSPTSPARVSVGPLATTFTQGTPAYANCRVQALTYGEMYQVVARFTMNSGKFEERERYVEVVA
jgi:hypothetical protein